jgi:hypothetical protein
MSDDELNDLIRRSSPAPEFQTSFQREVWRRIAVAETGSFSAVLGRFASGCLQWVIKPAGAATTVMSMLFIGASLGGFAAGRESESEPHLRAAYAATINPIRAAQAASQK